MHSIRETLKEMDEETYNHHVKSEKNDFSNWVKDVLNDEKLSRDLLKSTSKKSAAIKVEDRVALLELRR